MDIPRATITDLPPELFFAIFSYLPHRTIKAAISPLTSITHSSPSKYGLQNLSLASKSLRDKTLPYIFESITIRNLAQLEEFAKCGGIGDKVGTYVKRAVLRWDAYGVVVEAKAQSRQHVEYVGELMRKVVGLMPELKGLTVDFPGAIDALGYALEGGDVVKQLRVVNVRNGKWDYTGDITVLLHSLGKLNMLQNLAVDGTAYITQSSKTTRKFWPDSTAFRELVNLDVRNVATFEDCTLRGLIKVADKTTALTVKNCGGITLSGIRRLLMEHGKRLQYLSLQIIKQWVKEENRPDEEPEHEHELYRFSDDEHLCPIIRDHCKNLQMLDLFTNRICKEILFPGSNRSGAMTGGLPTPPGSPDLPPTREMEVPTPSIDMTSRTNMLPPPLFSFQHLSLFHQAEEERLVVAPLEKRKRMKKISLRIPYDASCYGSGMGGPAPQQRFTTLCDGSPANELVEIGRRAFEEGLAELANVQGHWKGGPYLIMKD